MSMKELRRCTMLLLTVTAALFAAGPVSAQPGDCPSRFKPFFMAVGITQGDTARLTAVTSKKDDDDKDDLDRLALSALRDGRDKARCRVTLSFVDARGKVLITPSGREVTLKTTLFPERVQWLDVRGRSILPPRRRRAQIRPVVTLAPDNPPMACHGLALAVEVIDNASRRTQVVYVPRPDQCAP